MTIVMAVVMAVGFELVRKRTLFGKLGMAVAYDPEMASAIGANTKMIAVVAFALAGIFAGVAGVLIGPITYSNPYLGDTYGIAGLRRPDDRRHGAAGGRDGGRARPRRPRRGREAPDQPAGVRLVPVLVVVVVVLLAACPTGS